MEHFTTIQLFCIWALPVLFAVTVHEAAHGFMAYLLGDKTALMLGRLTLNPLKHIDLIGTILVPAILLYLRGFMFGWAKPVPISSRFLKKPRRDMALIAATGPLANFVMMFIWAAIAKLGNIFIAYNLGGGLGIAYMGEAGIIINAVLMVLNLLPIPPLDGGHVLMGFIPVKWAIKIGRIESFGIFILFLLMMLGLLNFIIDPAVNFLHALAAFIFRLRF